MLKTTAETNAILARAPSERKGAEGLWTLAHFDFHGCPVRVHDRAGVIQVNGESWVGVGDVLRKNLEMRQPTLTSPSSRRKSDPHGRGAVSLPFWGADGVPPLREILHREGYRNRPLVIELHVSRADGSFVERIGVWGGEIVEYTRHTRFGDYVTFIAMQTMLESRMDRDDRRKGAADSARAIMAEDAAAESKRNLTGLLSGSVWGAIPLLNGISGVISTLIGFFKPMLPESIRAKIAGMPAIKKGSYAFGQFSCHKLPLGIFRRRVESVSITADTATEAREMFGAKVRAKVWAIPICFPNLFFAMDKEVWPMGFDLDRMRKESDPMKWEALVKERAAMWGGEWIQPPDKDTR